jgi:hypothetical protein
MVEKNDLYLRLQELVDQADDAHPGMAFGDTFELFKSVIEFNLVAIREFLDSQCKS